MKRFLILTCAAALALLAAGGAAFAVSDGTYSPGAQGCSGRADSSTHPDRTEEGCHSIQATVSDGSGHRYATASTDQTPDGTNVHNGSATIDPGSGDACTASADAGVTNGNPPGAPDGGCTSSSQTAPDPATGMRGYFGADDNLDSGEHDSSDYSHNGPSDGGGIRANLTPQTVAAWLDAVSAGNIGYLLTHPVPLIDAGFGACADGVCAVVTTERRTVYQGKGDGSRDVTDYEGKQWDPYTCGGPSDGKDSCGGHKLRWWNKQEGTVYAEPGVQVFEDPDPQGSPIDPLFDGGATPTPNLYPIPGVYAGTCGVTAGGGPVASLPAGTPMTNSAGQIKVTTAC